MARTPKHIRELSQQIQTLETDLQILRDKLPPKVRFEMALRRTRARAQGVSPRKIAEAARTAVAEVRREAGRRA